MINQVVVLDKYGTVYPVVNECHPNTGYYPYYESIGETVDWFCRTHPLTDKIFDYINTWMESSIAVLMSDEYPDGLSVQEVIDEIFWMDKKDLSKATILMIYTSLNNVDPTKDYPSPTDCAKKISEYLNQRYLRVRVGGKFNYERENTIYFRISSKGYDWRSVIIDYLWDTYDDPEHMPENVWIGHDEETNPPETVLFHGKCTELLEICDTKIYESYKSRLENLPDFNKERLSMYKNKSLLKTFSACKKTYKQFV